MQSPRHSAEHYDNDAYQRTVEIERGCVMGLDASEVYRRETDFSLRVAAAALGEGDRILDLASGAGNHIACMSDAFKGRVHIDGIEKAAKLAAMANDVVLAQKRKDVRERLQVHVGDMAHIRGALPEEKRDVQYKLVTCLGASFIYLNKAQREGALRDMFNILVPGGKLVLQWREPNRKLRKQKQHEIEERRGHRFAVHDIQRRGQSVGLLIDRQKGDAFYHYLADCTHPDPNNPDDYEMYRNTQTGFIEYREKDPNGQGVPHKSFGRAYLPDCANLSREEDLGPTTYNEFISTMHKDDAMAKLKGIGFRNVKFREDEEPLGYHTLYAIVATKPSREVEEGIERHKEFWKDKM